MKLQQRLFIVSSDLPGYKVTLWEPLGRCEETWFWK